MPLTDSRTLARALLQSHHDGVTLPVELRPGYVLEVLPTDCARCQRPLTFRRFWRPDTAPDTLRWVGHCQPCGVPSEGLVESQDGSPPTVRVCQGGHWQTQPLRALTPKA